MAQMIGDGPNRGKSAPPPRHRLPKQEDDGPRGETRREGSRAAAPTKALPKHTPAKYTYPFWGAVAHGVNDLFHSSPEDDRILAAIDAKLKRETRGESSTDGQPVSIFRGVMPDIEGQRNSNQIVQNYADTMNVKARLGRRDQARMDREAKDRTETEDVLTSTEWASLTPLQQAAAQANADLMAAVAKDFKDQTHHRANSSQKEGSTERIQGYLDKVNDLFGPEGETGYKGLEFAPNTVSFLETRGIGKDQLAGKTLDDFVSGDALIDDAAFEGLGQKSADPRDQNLAFAQTLASGQLKYQEQLAAQLKRGDQLLSDLTGRGTNAKATETYGANALPVASKMTEVRPDLLGQIDKYMQAMARTDIPLDQALSTIKMDLVDMGASDKESAQIWENMIERSRAATTGEAQWFDGVDFEMRNPLEVAQALGAPVLKREGAK